MNPLIVPLVILALAAATLLYCAVSDARSLRIPNAATGTLALLGILYGLVTEDFAWGSHAGAFALIFAACFVLFHFGLLGGGDTKLIPVVAFWVGFADLLPFLLIMTVSGTVLGAAVAMHAAIKTRNLSAQAEEQNAWRKKAMPYGVAIGLAGVLFLAKAGYSLISHMHG